MLPVALWVTTDITLLRTLHLPDLEFLLRLLGIILIDLTLAGDNALVIALAVRMLPPQQQVHGRVWGSLAAVVLRLLLVAVVSFLFRVPLLQLAGGLLLIWVALKLTRRETDVEGHVRRGATLSEAIRIIVIADVVMSLDNVIAVAAAARGNFLLVALGIALSLPLVVWGSGVLARLMTRYPWVIWIGGAILGYVAGEMMLKDPAVQRWLGNDLTNALRHPVAIALGMIIGVLGWAFAQNRRRRGSA
jgi:YjbE family integral membrane protein